MDSAELINSELKCLDRWLKSNKISINADKTKCMLFSYGKDVNFPDISIGNNAINELLLLNETLLHSNIDEEIVSSYNQIHCHNTRTNNQMSILRVNRSKTKHCVLHNDMITWNSLPDIFKVNVSFSMFKSKVRNFYLEKY